MQWSQLAHFLDDAVFTHLAIWSAGRWPRNYVICMVYGICGHREKIEAFRLFRSYQCIWSTLLKCTIEHIIEVHSL